MTFDIERSEIMNFDGVECFEKDGVVYLKLETVARGLGFTEIAASGNECIKWTRVRKYLAALGIDTSVDGKLPEFIPENIFYRLAMKAKNETAERFQAKIADEVIPSIRKHGAYLTLQAAEAVLLNPDTIIQLATQIKEEQARRMELEEKIEADAPKVLWAEQCLKSKTNMTVEEFSKVIFQKEDIEMGRNKTFAYLRKKKLLRSTNLPYQRYMDQGWFVVTVNLIETDRGTFQNKQTLITPKGQQAILKMIKEEQNNASTKELPVQEVYIKLQ